jgi:DNA-binding beta-propeller fold protein YncE
MRRLWSGMAAAVLGIMSAPPCARASAPDIVTVDHIVTGPTAFDSFRRPLDAAVDPRTGTVVVADSGRHRLDLFDAAFRSRGPEAMRAGEQGEPSAVAIDSRGRLFVVDPILRRVSVLTSRGSFIALLDPGFTPDLDSAAVPQDVQVGASGRVYVLYGGPRPGIVIVGPDARVVSRIGFDSPGTNLLKTPVAIAVNDAETAIAVADPEAARPVVILGPDGTERGAWGKHGEGDAAFSLASDVAWGPEGTLWVTDTLRHSISVFDARGEYRGRLGGFGFGPGQFYHPICCAFTGPDRLLVLERAGARFQVLEVSIPSAPDGGTS